MARTFRLAVAQSEVVEDPADVTALRASAVRLRELMAEARDAGARLVQFPEGAITYPHKRVMSVHGPERVGPADWTRAAWPVLRAEAEAIAELAGRLGIWVAFGSIHPLSGGSRPHNSLYVVSDTGKLVGRYDKRFLSNTELRYLYSPGTEPLVFEVDGVRFGCALCIEVNFPELFAEYERLDVDCVLVSVMVDDAARATVAQAYGTLYSYWLGYSVPAQFAATVPAGVVAPGGRWIARAPSRPEPGLAVADLELSDPDVATAVQLARPWRRTARAGLYDNHVVRGNPRSDDRGTF
ncbi:carbon-nitrogen hydrolase family protein [Amycolatopsis sp. NBC_01307]|uniref:carbon-nitrogen hydrolase family protein n=1 Tax=Amycolatopsis sp. NBC_01307 TaxID=2903561 RepID=UPI002E1341C5|nr:carbon-nitrogen hydrolase family protein [Amycolatopsis sp. NBC_01307]